jgi:hypothetical protein
MSKDLNYTVNRKPKFVFDGEEYKLNKSVKIKLELARRVNEIEKKEKIEQKKIKEAEAKGEEYESNFNYMEEMLNKVLIDSLVLTVNKEFAEKVLSYEPSEEELTVLYKILEEMRAGKTQEEAEQIVLGTGEKEEEKKA